MRQKTAGLVRAALPAACAATGPAVLVAIHLSTGGRWAFPSDRWHDLASWLGIPATLHPVLVAGWCATGGAALGVAARAAGDVAIGLGMRPSIAIAVAAALTLNGAAIRLSFEFPRAGIGVAAVLWIVAGSLERWPRRRRPGPSRTRTPGRRDIPAAVILVLWGWLLLPGAIHSAGRVAGKASTVMTAPPDTFRASGGPLLHGIPGWRIADSLDLAVAGSERAHEYRVSGDAVTVARALPDPVARRVVHDGGRETALAETFTMQAVRERPVILIARLVAGRGGRVRVRWNGVPMPPVRLSATPTAFQSIVIAEDRGQLVGAENRVIVERPDGDRIAAFTYTLLQPSR